MTPTKITRKTKLKFLTPEGTGGNTLFVWPIGEWVRVEGPLALCVNGLHGCYPKDWSTWANATAHIMETSGRGVFGRDKFCYREARLSPALPTWNAKSQRLLACDIAERVLHLANDPRSTRAVEVSRAYARGLATEDELTATRAPTWEAARWAAREAGKAARAAAWEAWEAARAAQAA